MTPRPRDTSARPASNCGFTSSTSGARGAATASMGPSARPRLMNERSATTPSTGPPTSSGVEVADVGALVHRHPIVAPQPLVQLPAADVDGDDRGGAVLQQAVGEPAGRRADVEPPTTGA